MKKNATFLILLMTFYLVKSQSVYHKMLGDTNRWSISGFVIGVKLIPSQNTSQLGSPCLGYYRATKDSVYMNKTYKVFEEENVYYCTYSGASTKFKTTIIREDTITHKLFMVHPDSVNESICIDFSMNVGDSIYLPFHPFSSVLKNGYYKLDSITPKQEILGLRNHFYLSKHDAPINYNTGKKFFIEWIESIGATHFPVNIVAEEASNDAIVYTCISNQYYSYVTCKFTNHQKQYQDSCTLNYAKLGVSNHFEYHGDACQLTGFPGAVHNLSFTNNLNIYPNPIINNELYVEFQAIEFNPIDITIYNVLGDVIYSKHFNIVTSNNKIVIPNLHLTSGLYNLQLSTSKETSSYKIIKE